MFEDAALAAAARRFVTCLVRVPQAYELVRTYEAVRPGLLVLDADAKKRGAIALTGAGAPEAVAYLDRVLTAPGPVEDEGGGTPLAFNPATPGHFQVLRAGGTVLAPGDRLVSIDEIEISNYNDYARLRESGKRFRFDRNGETLEVESTEGAQLAFVVKR